MPTPSPYRPVTLRDIAEALGVHPSTVSLALRSHPSIPEATRVRVQSQAEALGYRPDPMLRSLLAYSSRNRMERTGAVLALVILYQDFETWKLGAASQRYLEGIQRKADQLGYTVEIFCPAVLAKEGKELDRILRARGIRGVILISPVHETISHVLDWRHYATVKIGYAMEVPQVHRVLHHFRFAVRTAVAELRRRGYKRFGLAYSPLHEKRLEDGWTGGFLIEQYKAAKDEAFFFYQQQFPDGAMYDKSEYEAFKKWFEKHRPEVILSSLGWAPRYLWQKLKLQFPEQVGFVDLAWPVERRSFAGIDERLEHVGAAAVEQVASMLHNCEYGLPELPKTIVLGGRWVEGNSVRPVPDDKIESLARLPGKKSTVRQRS
jgi:LacI family transcriptional regulator